MAPPYETLIDGGWTLLGDTGAASNTFAASTDLFASDIDIPQAGTLRVTFFNGDADSVLKISGMVPGVSSLNGGTAVTADTPYTTAFEVRDGDSINFEVSAETEDARLIVSMVYGGVI